MSLHAGLLAPCTAGSPLTRVLDSPGLRGTVSSHRLLGELLDSPGLSVTRFLVCSTSHLVLNGIRIFGFVHPITESRMSNLQGTSELIQSNPLILYTSITGGLTGMCQTPATKG